MKILKKQQAQFQNFHSSFQISVKILGNKHQASNEVIRQARNVPKNVIQIQLDLTNLTILSSCHNVRDLCSTNFIARILVKIFQKIFQLF